MVTLDIEDTSIRIMTVAGRRVQTAASLPLEPGLVHDGVIMDPANMPMIKVIRIIKVVFIFIFIILSPF